MSFYSFRLRRHILLLLLLVAIFLYMALQYDQLTTIDTIVSNFIQDLRTDWLTEIFIFITYLGSFYISYPLVLICSFYCFIHEKVYTGLIIIINLVGVRYLNAFLKNYFSRERPEAEHLIAVGGLSFPSGHSMNSIAFLGFLAFLLWYYAKKSGRDYSYFITGIILLIFLIGISRIYLGVHYPSDVIGGFAAGGIWLIISINLFRRLVISKNRT